MIKINRNPYNICTLNPNSNCNNCKNNRKIDCKFNIKHSIRSMTIIFSFIITSTIGLYYISLLIQNLWILIIFLIYIFLLFIIIEPFVTCSHCPFYAEKRFRFNCTGNILTPKIWKYNTKPINKYEQAITLVAFIIFYAYPILSEIYGLWHLYENGYSITSQTFLILSFIFLLNMIICVIFIYLFLLVYCPKCINFSCIFNRVPKSNVDEYLNKNPIIKEAWKNSGYKFL